MYYMYKQNLIIHNKCTFRFHSPTSLPQPYRLIIYLVFCFICTFCTSSVASNRALLWVVPCHLPATDIAIASHLLMFTAGQQQSIENCHIGGWWLLLITLANKQRLKGHTYLIPTASPRFLLRLRSLLPKTRVHLSHHQLAFTGLAYCLPSVCLHSCPCTTFTVFHCFSSHTSLQRFGMRISISSTHKKKRYRPPAAHAGYRWPSGKW